MRKPVAAAFVFLFMTACGGQSPSSAPAATPEPTAMPPADGTPAPARISERVAVIVDVPGIAGKPQEQVAALLGEAIACETVKQGKKCFFGRGETAIVFISGKADWITIEALDGASYSDDVLPLLGLEKTAPVSSDEHGIRWETIPGLLEVTVFPLHSGVDYVYIKTATP